MLGKAPAGVGIGSKAALAQANCDPERKRTNYATVGGGPFCVNPWPEGKDNGGATVAGRHGHDGEGARAHAHRRSRKPLRSRAAGRCL